MEKCCTDRREEKAADRSEGGIGKTEVRLSLGGGRSEERK